jgi:hypothetical protein
VPAPRRHRSLSDRQVELGRHVGSPAVGGATNAFLRANLHELAAEFHDLAASIHDLAAEDHALALRDSLGDASFHRLWIDLRQTAAAVDRAKAESERRAAEYWRGHPEADGVSATEGRSDGPGP